MSRGTVFGFGPFALDTAARRLTRDGSPVPLSDRHLDVLIHLLAHAGSVVPKNALIEAAWRDVAVTDNSLEQAVSALRRALETPAGEPAIDTVPRQGYRFRGALTRAAARAPETALDAMLAPHRAWIEGRAALETLERDQILRARHVFEGIVASAPDRASAHVGLANACVMSFETTRADEQPDLDALARAEHHAREACRLDPDHGEAWATLGFVLDRVGRRLDAMAASRRAVDLEGDNWRHHFRLAYVSWGEERLRAARRTLTLLPGFALAHWLAATVHVARHALDEAERDLSAGLAGHVAMDASRPRFSAVALHWLRGLVRLARGDESSSLEDFERELACEPTGHLYARECCANAWYAMGAVHWRQGRSEAARLAFEQAIARLPFHPMARLARSVLMDRVDSAGDGPTDRGAEGWHTSLPAMTIAMVGAARLVLAGDHAGAAGLVDRALADAPEGSAGWLLPVEPLLHVSSAPAAWAPTLARLRARAA